MRHHRWFVPRCISDPWYSYTPTRSCHRGLDKASLTLPPSPWHLIPRGATGSAISARSGGRTQPNPRTREEKLCAPALCHALRTNVSTRNGVCFAKGIPAAVSNRSLIWVDTRWIISSRFLEWINQRAIVIVSCVCCIWKRGWKYSKRRGVDARNCKKIIDLWTVFSSEDSYFSEFTFSLTT